jgi:hypothetical protein
MCPATPTESHYGLSRTFNVLLDILRIRFLSKYFTRSMHFFSMRACWEQCWGPSQLQAERAQSHAAARALASRRGALASGRTPYVQHGAGD